MKIKLPLLLATTLFLLCSLTHSNSCAGEDLGQSNHKKTPASPNNSITSTTDGNWYPFHFPAKLDPDSPMNAGKLLLDAPAGKHGFVKVKDAHFVFEDGTPARFWGTNLVFEACFPEKKDAELLADRIAFFGFNAVRLHHMDYYFEPRGIFEDTAPAFKDPQMKKTGKLSPTQLDRLDYLVFQLKQRGIYVNINLLVARYFTKADGVIDAGKLGMAAKPAAMFDPVLIELQKKFAKDLLTHYNPYTKTRYNEEPAVALVEVINETSILYSWKQNSLNYQGFNNNKNAIPETYSRFLDTQWNNWLKEKYGSPEKVKHAWALVPDSNTANEPKILNSPDNINQWRLEQLNGTTASLATYGNTATIRVQTVTPTPWHVQFRRSGFNLKKEKNYVLTLTATSVKDTRIQLSGQFGIAPWTNLQINEEFNISTNKKEYSFKFSPSQDCANAKIAFNIGQSPNTITFYDILIKETAPNEWLNSIVNEKFQFQRPIHKFLRFLPTQTRNDITRFYSDLQSAYTSTMIAYLKNELKIQAPITGIGGIWLAEDGPSEPAADYIDAHGYWDHPTFPKKSRDKNDLKMTLTSMLNDKKHGIIGRFKQHLPLSLAKPRTITEWNHCYPNPFAYETPVWLAAQARIEGYDAVFQFAFQHHKINPEGFDNNNSYIDIIANPQQLILNAVAARIMLQAAPPPSITVENGVFTIDSNYIQGASGELKNHPIHLSALKINSTSNGAIFILSQDKKTISKSDHLTAIKIGKIKNEGSLWTKPEFFDWGKPNILLEHLPVTLTLKNSNTLTGQTINLDAKKNITIYSNKEIGANYFDLKRIASPIIEFRKK